MTISPIPTKRYGREYMRELAAHGRLVHHPGAKIKPPHENAVVAGTLGPTRTADTRFRKPLLYPLSYEGRRSARSFD